MIIDHADGLHEGVADSWANESGSNPTAATKNLKALCFFAKGFLFIESS